MNGTPLPTDRRAIHQPCAIPAPLWDRAAYEAQREQLLHDASLIAGVYDYFEETRDECH